MEYKIKLQDIYDNKPCKYGWNTLIHKTGNDLESYVSLKTLFLNNGLEDAIWALRCISDDNAKINFIIDILKLNSDIYKTHPKQNNLIETAINTFENINETKSKPLILYNLYTIISKEDELILFSDYLNNGKCIELLAIRWIFQAILIICKLYDHNIKDKKDNSSIYNPINDSSIFKFFIKILHSADMFNRRLETINEIEQLFIKYFIQEN